MARRKVRPWRVGLALGALAAGAIVGPRLVDGLAAAFASVEQIVIVSAALKLFWALVALVAVFVVLRLFDWFEGIDFKRDVWANMKDDPNALAMGVYRGLVFIGVALLVGNILH